MKVWDRGSPALRMQSCCQSGIRFLIRQRKSLNNSLVHTGPAYYPVRDYAFIRPFCWWSNERPPLWISSIQFHAICMNAQGRALFSLRWPAPVFTNPIQIEPHRLLYIVPFDLQLAGPCCTFPKLHLGMQVARWWWCVPAHPGLRWLVRERPSFDPLCSLRVVLCLANQEVFKTTLQPRFRKFIAGVVNPTVPTSVCS